MIELLRLRRLCSHERQTSAFLGFRRRGSDTRPHFCYRRMSVFPNHFYFYIRDRACGPAFIKTVGYTPYAMRVSGMWES